MTKIKLDSFVSPENLAGATADKPKEAVIKGYSLVQPKDLPFESEEARHQLSVELGEDELTWLPNKTSLKAFIAAFGDESESWVGKKIKLYLVDQNVSGQMKKVVYGKV